MNIEEFRDYCLSKKHVTECFPFDEKTLVFKVANKMFALSGGIENGGIPLNNNEGFSVFENGFWRFVIAYQWKSPAQSCLCF